MRHVSKQTLHLLVLLATSSTAFADPSLEIQPLSMPAFDVTPNHSYSDPSYARHTYWGSPDVGAGVGLNVEANYPVDSHTATFHTRASTAKFEVTYHSGLFASNTYSINSTITMPASTIVSDWSEYRSQYLSVNDYGGGPVALYGIADTHIPNILNPFIQLYYGVSSETQTLFSTMKVSRKLSTWYVAGDYEICSKFTFAPMIPRIAAHVGQIS